MSNELIAAAFGAMLGGFVTYRFALHLVRKQHALTLELAEIEHRRSACASFRAVFAPTLAFIYIARHHGTHDRPNIDPYIKAALLQHGAAIEVFRPFVVSRSKGYQQAWENYRNAASMGHEDRGAEEWDHELYGYEILLERHIHFLLQFTDA